MKREFVARLAVLLLVVVFLLPSVGCNRVLLGTNTVSVVAGWLLGSVATSSSVERLCYQNGELIDCADLPADLGQ